MARRILAALLIVLASLLAPFAVGAFWAERTITETQTFTETLAPLSDDPHVQEAVSTEVSAAIISAVDAGSRAEDLLGNLDGPLAGLRDDRDLDSVIGAAVAAGVNQAITAGVDAYVTSDRFGQGWETITAALQEQIIALLENRDPDSAVTLTEGQIVLDTGVALDRITMQLDEQGVPFVASLDVPGRQIVLADAPNLQLAANALSIFMPIAAMLWVVVLLMFVGGILLWRPRSRGVLWTGLGLTLGAAVAYFGLDLGSASIAQAAPTGYGPLVGSVVETMLRFLVNALLVMLTIGVALMVAGWLGGATPAGTRARRAITGRAHGWGEQLAGDSIGRYTAEHPLLVPTLRGVLIALALLYLILADRLSPGEVVLTALMVGVSLVAIEVLEGAGLGYESQRAGAIVAEPIAPE